LTLKLDTVALLSLSNRTLLSVAVDRRCIHCIDQSFADGIVGLDGAAYNGLRVYDEEMYMLLVHYLSTWLCFALS
jgi:hypothetical protein